MFLKENTSLDARSSERLNRARTLLYLARFMAVVLVFMLGSFSFSNAQNVPSSVSAPHSGSMHRPGNGATAYMQEDDLNFLYILPPYPVIESQEDDADTAELRQWQQSGSSARWQLAQADADLSYSRFANALGNEIDPVSTPLLAHLLDRVEADMSGGLRNAKSYYNRPRPYQRFQMEHVCGFDPAPVAEPSPKGGNSYPSGHAIFGWSAALVLAEVAPERAQAILARGREYGESRIVCAVHYPSDVIAGELMVSAVVGKLDAIPEFKRDMSCAQQEHAVAIKTRTQISSECLSLKNQLGQKQEAFTVCLRSHVRWDSG